ncbi:hypothetical protein EIP86_002484 [Pleurotus ostreatoroseus]|nr:hypothetical protein EIP86_002484 [Pleurotus ostreatoroseus]
MSYDNNNFDNTNNFQNDPSLGGGRHHHNTGAGTGDAWDMNTSQNQGGLGGQQGFQDQNNFGAQQGFQDQSGLGSQSGYDTQGGIQGNTTDANTFGTGGDFGNTGRQRGDDWNQGTQQQSWDNSGAQTGTGGFNDDYGNTGTGGQTGQQKPSMGDKVMGGMEKLAGKVTRNEGMVERGQERKEGDFDRPNY